jgi:hypothetical protein
MPNCSRWNHQLSDTKTGYLPFCQQTAASNFNMTLSCGPGDAQGYCGSSCLLVGWLLSVTACWECRVLLCCIQQVEVTRKPLPALCSKARRKYACSDYTWRIWADQGAFCAPDQQHVHLPAYSSNLHTCFAPGSNGSRLQAPVVLRCHLVPHMLGAAGCLRAATLAPSRYV